VELLGQIVLFSMLVVVAIRCRKQADLLYEVLAKIATLQITIEQLEQKIDRGK
jgi:hypothetical protein